MLALSLEHLTPCDLDTFLAYAETLNQHNRETCTTPPSPRLKPLALPLCMPALSLTLTAQGDVDGGLRGLVGVPLDFRCPRSWCATASGTRDGSRYDTRQPQVPRRNCQNRSRPR